MTPRELATLSLASAARLIREGSLSATALTAKVLDRASELNASTHAYITIMRERAMETAAKRDRDLAAGTEPGLLHGVPVAIKDLVDVAGVPTTAGSPLFARRVPETNAVIVDRLEAAGAVIVGKTNLHEFAFGVTNENPHFGATRNPWDRERISGGSSGGSAVAVALSMAIAAIGTDTGGSIRIPSALCGVVGLKPTFGSVPVTGIVPLAGRLDHVGPMTRTVEDAALLLEVIAGNRTSAAAESRQTRFLRELGDGIRGLRIGIPRATYFQKLQTGVAGAVEEAIGVLERLGADLAEVRLPDTGTHEDMFRFIATTEAYVFHRERLESTPEQFGEDVRKRLLAGKDMKAVDFVGAEQARENLRKAVNAVFDDVDMLAFPTLPVTAPRVGEGTIQWVDSTERVLGALTRNTRLANLTGLPAISVPCGFSDDLPVGLQIVGPANRECLILRAAAAYERASHWNLVPGGYGCSGRS